MKKRLEIIISYTRAVYEKISKKNLSPHDRSKFYSIGSKFSLNDAQDIQKLEHKTNHDLKAIEEFLVDRISKNKLNILIPYVNLGIGSEDINSPALALQLKESRDEVLLPAIKSVISGLIELARRERGTVMVARTHAQPASLTTFGKEVANTLLRLCDELEIFQKLNFQAKCSGEVGSFSAHYAASNQINWLDFTDTFIRSFGLVPTPAATQIAPYDSIIRYFQSLSRLNAILIDFSKNIWLYILLGLIKITKVDREVGSAGMPHKVNPIYFEGAEGGLDIANGIIETLARVLMENRLQRSFADSTIRRNIVIPVSYSLLSYQSLAEGLKRLTVDKEAIAADLARHQEVWLEVVKTYAKLHGIPGAYAILKEKTRGRTLTRSDLKSLIKTLSLTIDNEKELIEMIEKNNNPYPDKVVDEAVLRAHQILKP